MNPDTLKLTQTIPLPLFNRNPGYLCETLAEVAATEARYVAEDISLAEILPVRRDWAAVQALRGIAAGRDAGVGRAVTVCGSAVKGILRAVGGWTAMREGCRVENEIDRRGLVTYSSNPLNIEMLYGNYKPTLQRRDLRAVRPHRQSGGERETD